jgi:hypothetical protein
MFALVQDGNILKYPYSTRDLARDNPNTSFAVNLTDTDLLDFGMHRVFFTTLPVITSTQTFRESNPVFNTDSQRWEQNWEIRDLTTEEIESKSQEYLNGIRAERNRKLVESDWTQGKDIPDSISGPWAVYRQQLRDLPDTITDPSTFTDWPQVNL